MSLTSDNLGAVFDAPSTLVPKILAAADSGEPQAIALELRNKFWQIYLFVYAPHCKWLCMLAWHFLHQITNACAHCLAPLCR
jgi:hypothetical protein